MFTWVSHFSCWIRHPQRFPLEQALKLSDSDFFLCAITLAILQWVWREEELQSLGCISLSKCIGKILEWPVPADTVKKEAHCTKNFNKSNVHIWGRWWYYFYLLGFYHETWMSWVCNWVSAVLDHDIKDLYYCAHTWPFMSRNLFELSLNFRLAKMAMDAPLSDVEITLLGEWICALNFEVNITACHSC